MNDLVVNTIVRASGFAAIGLLFATLAVTPLGRFGTRVAPETARGYPRIRRKLGITTASVALAHATLALSLWVRGPLVLLLEWPFLRAGAAALLVLCLLLMTSFPRVVRALRLGAWKELHRLAYVAAFFALLHLAFAPLGGPTLLLSLLGVAGVLSLSRLLVRGARGEGG